MSNFQIKKSGYLALYDTEYFQLEHARSGAQYLHLQNDDPVNTFCLACRIIPDDSSGIFHILEHMILKGSKKYPGQGSFQHMKSRSVSRYMNGFTSTDWIMFAFSTPNTTDFYHLLDFYLDIFFFPSLTNSSFLQEGVRLEKTKGGVDFNGVVFNEMKEAVLSMNHIVTSAIYSSVLPETCYSYNFGGSPSEIVDVTLPQIKKKHSVYFKPDNCYFYSYGNLSFHKHLKIIDTALEQFPTRRKKKFTIKSQPRFISPIKVHYPYPVIQNEASPKRYHVCVAWLLTRIDDPVSSLMFIILSHILLSTAGSIFRKKINDSGYGTGLLERSGYDGNVQETIFSIGVKNVDQAQVPVVEKMILDTLKELSENGFEQDMIEAALHQIEFDAKERSERTVPFGLKMFFSALPVWMNGGDPVKALDFEEQLERLKKRLKKKDFLKRVVKQYFIENTHRTTVVFYPDTNIIEDVEKNIRKKAILQFKKLSNREIAKQTRLIASSTEKVETGNHYSTLSLSDISTKLPQEDKKQTEDFTLYDRVTSGIQYFTSAIGVGHIDDNLLPYLPLYCFLFSALGTRSMEYDRFSRALERYTGGIGMSINASRLFNSPGGCLPYISLSGKCLDKNFSFFFELLTMLIKENDFSSVSRIERLLLVYRERLKSSILKMGHQFAASLASRYISKTHSLHELWFGFHQMQFINNLFKDNSLKNPEGLSKKLSEIHSAVFTGNNIKAALIGCEKSIASSHQLCKTFFSQLSAPGKSGFTALSNRLPDKRINEVWEINSSLSYISLALGCHYLDQEEAALLTIGAKLLTTCYLYKEVRDIGGAYGVFSIYNPLQGSFNLASYRDKNIKNTLDIFSRAFTFLSRGDFSKDDLDHSIIKAISSFPVYGSPEKSCKKDFFRSLIGVDHEIRESYLQKLKSVTRKKIQKFAGAQQEQMAEKSSKIILTNKEQSTNVLNSLSHFSIHKL